MAEQVRAWRPEVPGVREVLRADFHTHAYPAHTHDSWTVLLLDRGTVSYSIDRSPRLATPDALTLLPPEVPHDGRATDTEQGFRKRVLYLDAEWVPPRVHGWAAAHPDTADPSAVTLAREVHRALAHRGDELRAEQAVRVLASVVGAGAGIAPGRPRADAPLARRLRDHLDERLAESVTLAEVAVAWGLHPDHLLRSFSRAYGISPHRYVTGRRVEIARRLLLAGRPPAEVAAEAGFYDQAHLTRHFRRMLGTTPARFAA